jgi:hypothetical protein
MKLIRLFTFKILDDLDSKVWSKSSIGVRRALQLDMQDSIKSSVWSAFALKIINVTGESVRKKIRKNL